MYLTKEEDEKQNLIEVSDKKDFFDIEKGSPSSSEKPVPVPNFISLQISMMESKFLKKLCCCFSRKKYTFNDIKNEELMVYYSMKNLAIQQYDENNITHEESLKALYLNSLRCELTVDLKNKFWKQIGFQSDNPRTDFRGAGYFSLLFIIYFAEQNEKAFTEMIDYEYFLFAIVAIRLAFLFKIVFHFIEDEKDQEFLIQSHGLNKITIPQFKNFIRRQFHDENYHNKILSSCLVNIKEEYKKQFNREKNELNFLIIEPIILKCFHKHFYEELDREEN